MREPGKIRELEAEIAEDKQKLSEIKRLNIDLLRDTERKGFGAVSTELKYRGEMERLEDSIRKDEQRLAGAKTQPAWPRE